jgi:hypothetical protein
MRQPDDGILGALVENAAALGRVGRVVAVHPDCLLRMVPNLFEHRPVGCQQRPGPDSRGLGALHNGESVGEGVVYRAGWPVHHHEAVRVGPRIFVKVVGPDVVVVITKIVSPLPGNILIVRVVRRVAPQVARPNRPLLGVDGRGLAAQVELGKHARVHVAVKVVTGLAFPPDRVRPCIVRLG